MAEWKIQRVFWAAKEESESFVKTNIQKSEDMAWLHHQANGNFLGPVSFWRWLHCCSLPEKLSKKRIKSQRTISADSACMAHGLSSRAVVSWPCYKSAEELMLWIVPEKHGIRSGLTSQSWTFTGRTEAPKLKPHNLQYLTGGRGQAESVRWLQSQHCWFGGRSSSRIAERQGSPV